MAPPFLEIKGVRKSFGDHTVLDGVNLKVERGSITTIMGKSGIGKSVLLKCIAGVYHQDAGEILLEGNNCVGNDCGKNGPRLSYLFQQNALFDSMTALDNVALPLIETTKISRRGARRKAEALFKQLDLVDVQTKYPAQMSGGMQKRVALARALITQPQLILFDEPTTGLDPQRKNGVFEMVADYRRRFDFTALIVSHDIPEALFVSDTVAWLDRGQIRFLGAPVNLESARDPELLEFVYHRNALLSGLAGQQGRSALFADWKTLREKYDQFVIATCSTDRRRPGAELGLRRFASYQAAIATLTQLQRERSDIYFLDERHFGFAVGLSPKGSVDAEMAECLQVVNDAPVPRFSATFHWSARTYFLKDVPTATALWDLEDSPPADPSTPASSHELTKN